MSYRGKNGIQIEKYPKSVVEYPKVSKRLDTVKILKHKLL